METNIQRKVNELNKRYHRIIRDRFIVLDQDIEQFKNLVKQVKSWGYRFRLATPEIDFTAYGLIDLESKLISRLELVRQEKKYGVDNHLYKYAHLMRDCEKSLCREIYVSLCKREVIDNRYFHVEGISNQIDFIQSGHWTDVYILF